MLHCLRKLAITLLITSCFVSGAARAADNFVVRDGALPSSTVKMVDARPTKEIKGGLPLLFDPTYSIPDKRFTPPLLNLLAATLSERIPRAAGKTIVIERLQVQNYFRKTYEKGQATSLLITGGLAGALVAAIDGKEQVDALRFRLQGKVDGIPFMVDLAEPYEAGRYSGMVYNGDGATAATISIVRKGIDAGVTAIEASVAAKPINNQ